MKTYQKRMYFVSNNNVYEIFAAANGKSRINMPLLPYSSNLCVYSSMCI
ncbi:MAG: hypothetical protein Q4F95_00435 [Oscillospiraceae bacterium]|nr:hypothetical protein [Oscillospiraceae bacterium]